MKSLRLIWICRTVHCIEHINLQSQLFAFYFALLWMMCSWNHNSQQKVIQFLSAELYNIEENLPVPSLGFGLLDLVWVSYEYQKKLLLFFTWTTDNSSFLVTSCKNKIVPDYKKKRKKKVIFTLLVKTLIYWLLVPISLSTIYHWICIH